MKVSLGCCYQCDVPPDNIKNLRIFCGRISYTAHTKSVVFAHLKKCATTTRKIFLFFFRVGPPSWALGFKRVGPPSTLKLASCQENYFYFLFDFWD